MTQTINKQSSKKTDQTQSKSVYIETFGCQMNKADSENMLGLLEEIGYKKTDDLSTADLKILNTCAIREGAEDKVFSYLGHWRRLKEQRPGSLIAVGGCVAQDAGADLIRRAPGVDIVFGTHNLFRLPELVMQAVQSKKPVVEIIQELPDDLPELPVIRQSSLSAWVSIIYGCDYNCTYCIVPYVRGREKSRPADQIVQEVRELADAGYKEVVFLGQNVTAYGHDLDPAIHLGDLIRRTGEIEEIKRVRFVTGHPRDLKDEIIDAVSDVWNACEYFHVPIQAGDDRTLRRMARGYKVDFYRRMVEKIRAKMPDAAITSDMIVGFPGETEAEFMNTVNLVEELCFDSCNTAAYSPRPHTPAANWPDQVPEHEKYERLRFLNSVVSEVSHRRNKRYLGKKVEVLVEGPSQRNAERMAGRTRTGKVVNFEGSAELIGQLVDVTIEAANAWALRGAKYI
ncbi:MAG: tRNA (N6-isopentenyl adenosine(37)-C2)-methylthiotransferase MiaB [Candidatus Obscuribacterales bacterium]|jgi:tRNA-2-methylthio-N6-dimethylallyladenosine synthase|nr:tRNA (N6-isopentenyl adenosine(37)-C2)-methylthiotransferase MiaB [Candidatus Obscuribacterales bacterium]